MILKIISVFCIIINISMLMISAEFPGMNWDFEIQRVEPYTETSDILSFHLKPVRFNKTVYVINGNLTLKKDITQGYDAEVILSHSSKGNNQFVLAPFRLNRQPFNSIVNKEYRKYIMSTFTEQITDLPISSDSHVDLTKMFKWGHTYTLKNYLFDKSKLPRLSDGLYKLCIIIYKGTEAAGGIVVLAKVYRF